MGSQVAEGEPTAGHLPARPGSVLQVHSELWRQLREVNWVGMQREPFWFSSQMQLLMEFLGSLIFHMP